MKSLVRHSTGKCQVWEPWPDLGNLALEAQGLKNEEFKSRLNKKVSALGAQARLARKVPGLPISF